MKINMQIVLTHEDIANAVRSYLRSEIPLSEDQEISIQLFRNADDTFGASAVVDKGEAVVQDTKPAVTGIGTGVRERGKPSPGRGRRTQAEIAEDEAADKAEAAEKTTVTEEVAQTLIVGDDREVSEEDNTPPFEVDSKTEQTNAQIGAIDMTNVVTKGPATTTQIFPNIGNSAPAITSPEPSAPPVAVSAKSLFANLGSPASH